MAVPKTRVSYSKKKIRKQQWFKKILNSNKKTLTQLKSPNRLDTKEYNIKTYKKNIIELLFTYKTQVRKLVKDLLLEKSKQYQIKLFQKKLLREKLEKAIEKRGDLNKND